MLLTSRGGILYHLGCRASTRGSACTKGRAGNTFQFCTSDGLIGVWCKHYLWCHPSGLIDLNEPLGSCTTWFMLHFFGACSKKDWYRIESGAWCKHQVVCGAWCMAQNNGTEFHLVPNRGFSVHQYPNWWYHWYRTSHLIETLTQGMSPNTETNHANYEAA